LTDIITEEEQQEYDSTHTLEEKQAFFRKFWRSREALPAEDYNERLVEHYRRLNYAKLSFSSKMQNGYDDRGRIYIKHGEPDQKVSDNFRSEYDNESWLYRKQPKNFIFHFIRPLAVYRIAFNLPLELYETRGELDPVYGLGYMKIFSGTMTETDYASMQMDENEVLLPAFTLGETTETFRAYQGSEPLNYYFSTADFLSEGSNSSLNVYYGLPLNEIEIKTDSKGAGVSYECSYVVFDQDYNIVSRAFDKRSYSLGASPPKAAKGAMLADGQVLNLPAGDYHFAVRVKDLNSEHLGIFRGDIEVTPYEHGKFNVSQILLATDLKKLQEGQKPGKFTRGEFNIIPLPSCTFRKDQQVIIYCEVYYLNEGGQEKKSYSIDFTITADKLDKGLVSKIFSPFGKLLGKREQDQSITMIFQKEQDNPRRVVQPEYISIDISDSPPGKYSLEITVTDNESGEQVTRNAFFMVVEGG
jgi:GWxTD domain-containing protein